MYSEKHYFQNQYTRWVQWMSAGLALWQLGALLGAETGLPWLPFGYTVHLVALFFALILLVMLNNAGLSIRVSTKGWALRHLPFQIQPQRIGWEEVKMVRLLKPGELHKGQGSKGFQRRFGHTFLISNPAYDVLCIELINGFQVFVSIRYRSEMIEFLHHGRLQMEMKKKVTA